MSSNWIKRSTRQRIYERDNHTCVYCEQTVLLASGMSREDQIAFMRDNKDRIATLDHIISQYELSLTANNLKKAIKNPCNLVTACNACNSSKKHTRLDIWCRQKNLDYNVIVNRIQERLAA